VKQAMGPTRVTATVPTPFHPLQIYLQINFAGVRRDNTHQQQPNQPKEQD
jgi:hypothetical protein